MSVAELQAATKSYGVVQALRGIDLAIEPGQLLALLGPNGAGKTTAVKLLLGQRSARVRTGAMLQVARVPESLRGPVSTLPQPPCNRAYHSAALPQTVGQAVGLCRLPGDPVFGSPATAAGRRQADSLRYGCESSRRVKKRRLSNTYARLRGKKKGTRLSPTFMPRTLAGLRTTQQECLCYTNSKCRS
ncbi:MAG: ATP-binding cassette domain-containing protein [Bryobacteraceae bacterium]